MNYFTLNCLFSQTQYSSFYISSSFVFVLVLIGNNFYPVNAFDYRVGVVRTFYKL